MIATIACPSAEKLEVFFRAELAAAEMDAIAGHLSSCDKCAGSAELWHTTAVDLDFAKPPTDLINEEEIRAADPVIERILKRFRNHDSAGPQAITEVGNSHDTKVGTPKRAVTAGEFPFLSPSDVPGEIGRLDEFRIRGILGQGGMGAVFEAYDARLDRLVAIKVMLPQFANEASAKQRFLREAKAVANIEHPNVVPVYQVGEVQDAPFMVMPLLKGKPLDQHLQRLEREPNRWQPLPVREVVRIGKEAALGLAAAHRAGVIHRDIKPSNIFLAKEKHAPLMSAETTSLAGAAGSSAQEPAAPARDVSCEPAAPARVQLLDFGLARQIDGDLQITSAGSILGTGNILNTANGSGYTLAALGVSTEK